MSTHNSKLFDSPKVFTTSAFIVGLLLIDDLNAQQQNDLGNWLMLVAQVLCTNAAFQSLINDRNGNNSQSNNQSNSQTIEMLEKTVQALQKEINELKAK